MCSTLVSRFDDRFEFDRFRNDRFCFILDRFMIGRFMLDRFMPTVSFRPFREV